MSNSLLIPLSPVLPKCPQYCGMAWVEFCKRKTCNRSSNNRMFSLHYTADAFEPGLSVAYTFFFSSLPAHIRMLTVLLDSRVNIFHTNDLKAIIYFQNARNPP